MAPKKKGGKKAAMEDWENELGEAAPVANAPEAPPADADAEGAEAEDDNAGGGGLMAIMRRKQKQKKEEAPPPASAEPGRLLTKSEKEKLKKEREKQRKKEQVSLFDSDGLIPCCIVHTLTRLLFECIGCLQEEVRSRAGCSKGRARQGRSQGSHPRAGRRPRDWRLQEEDPRPPASDSEAAGGAPQARGRGCCCCCGREGSPGGAGAQGGRGGYPSRGGQGGQEAAREGACRAAQA